MVKQVNITGGNMGTMSVVYHFTTDLSVVKREGNTAVLVTGECHANSVPGAFMRNKVEQFVLSQQGNALKMQIGELGKRLDRARKIR